MEERSDEPQLADIRDHWHWVRDGIQEILEAQKQLTFIPEEVYAACVNGEAQLWVAPEGFVITTGLKDEYARTSTLLIWIAWAEERGKDCVLKYMTFFSE